MTYLRTECNVYATWQEPCGAREREVEHARQAAEGRAETLADLIDA